MKPHQDVVNDREEDDECDRYCVHDEDAERMESELSDLKAENTALHTECDRLVATMTVRKILNANEVTKNDFYWQRNSDGDIWMLVYVYPDFMVPFNEPVRLDISGQFVGPLKMPEV